MQYSIHYAVQNSLCSTELCKDNQTSDNSSIANIELSCTGFDLILQNDASDISITSNSNIYTQKSISDSIINYTSYEKYYNDDKVFVGDELTISSLHTKINHLIIRKSLSNIVLDSLTIKEANNRKWDISRESRSQ
jgi:hypothetical protein